MKSLKLTTLLFAFTTVLTLTSAATPENIQSLKGASQTLLGNYTITEVAPETIKNEVLRKFELTYENGKAPVVIYLRQKSKCKEYIVRGHAMEVQYTCKKSGFGAQTLAGKFASYPYDTNAQFISEEALSHQSKITTSEVPVEKALGLIACYYPGLLKNIQTLYQN
jgi:hypothetical protein